MYMYMCMYLYMYMYIYICICIYATWHERVSRAPSAMPRGAAQRRSDGAAEDGGDASMMVTSGDET